MAAPRPRRPALSLTRALLLSFLAAAALLVVAPAASAAADDQTCVPSLQRLLSCLDFIEHRSEEIPVPCCIQVRRTAAEQPCCLMHVVRGNVGRLLGPEYDGHRAMVNVTAECLSDDSVLVSITRNCSGKPLLPLTPEFPFTTAAVPPPPPLLSGATRLQGSSSSIASLLLGLYASIVVYGAVAVLLN